MVQVEIEYNDYGDEFGLTVNGEYIVCKSRSELLNKIIDYI